MGLIGVMPMTNLPHDDHRQAVAMSRYWWHRYRRLSGWRKRARRRALSEAQYWAKLALKTKQT